LHPRLQFHQFDLQPLQGLGVFVVVQLLRIRIAARTECVLLDPFRQVRVVDVEVVLVLADLDPDRSAVSLGYALGFVFHHANLSCHGRHAIGCAKAGPA